MTNQRRLLFSVLSVGLGISLWGCSTDIPSETPNPSGVPNLLASGLVAPKFDPITPGGGLSALPIPNDLLRDPATGLNTQIPPGSDAQDSIRSLRGFSTTGNIIIPFDGKIDGSTVTPETILVVEGGPATDPNNPGTNNTIACNVVVSNPEGSGSAANSTVTLQPVLPLKPLTNYFVVITNGVRGGGRSIGTPKTTGSPAVNTGNLTKFKTPLIDGNGNTLVFPVPDATAQQLEPLRAAYQPFWERAESILGTNREEIPFVFRFGTQPLFAALAEPNIGVRKQNSVRIVGNPPTPTTPVNPASSTFINDDPLNKPAAGLTQANLDGPPFNGALGGLSATLGAPQTVAQFYAALAAGDARFAGAPHSNIRRIFTGKIKMPRYINPVTGFFDGEGLPLPGSPPIVPQATDLEVRFIMCSPDALPLVLNFQPFGFGAATPTARPAVIFQHGIDHDKRDVFLVADKICADGKIVVAIDLFWHGDLNPTLVLPPANQLPSGFGFINPGNMRATRDNFRQSISNLFFLNELMIRGGSAIDAVSVALQAPGSTPLPLVATPFSPVPGVNGPAPAFVGLSLGGIVGGPFTAVNPFSSRAVLNAAGGRLTTTLLDSPTRGPALKAALASNGVVEGTDSFAHFFFIAQTVLDDIDPLNYAAPSLAGTFKAGPPDVPAVQSSIVLQQELVGEQTIPNSSSRDLARAFAQFPAFRHVQAVLEAVTGVVPVASPYNNSGFHQFAGFGHEALLGKDGDVNQLTLLQAIEFVRTGNIVDNQP